MAQRNPYASICSRSGAVLLHHSWPSRLCTCGSHGTTPAMVWGLFYVSATDGASVLCVCVSSSAPGMYQECVRACVLSNIGTQKRSKGGG